MKYALKRLRHSDLTFFGPYFRKSIAANPTSTKQKALNLDAAVFADAFFPSLSIGNPDRPNKVLFDLTLVGPGGAPSLSLTRKAIIQAKNWRLNGELVDDEDRPTRFDNLAINDVAILRFDGVDTPSSVVLGIASAASPLDVPALAVLNALIGNQSARQPMKEVSEAQLAAALDALPAGHSLKLLLPDPELEQELQDAVAGDAEAVEAVVKKAKAGKTLRKISAEDLAKAKAQADHVGQLGEGLVAELLERERDASSIADFEHSSKINAINPYDFKITTNDGESLLVDVKSTTGGFDKSFHISGPEVRLAAKSEVPYHIYRVYGLADGTTPKMRRSGDIRDLAKTLDSVPLPGGAKIDGYTIATSLMSWSVDEDLDS